MPDYFAHYGGNSKNIAISADHRSLPTSKIRELCIEGRLEKQYFVWLLRRRS